MKQLVINTSSSLYFTKIGLISHLLKHFELITTNEILKEVKNGEELGYRDAKIIMHYIDGKKIRIIEAKKTKNIELEFKIDLEDASVISLANELNCLLATEDRQMEKICLVTQTNVTNAAVLLYYLWEKRDFSKDQTLLLLDILDKSGYNKEIILQIKELVLKGEYDD